MPPTPADPTIQQKLMITRTIAFALSSGVIMFLGIVLFLGKTGSAQPNPSIPLFVGLCAVVWVTNFVAGRLLFQRRLAPAALAPLVAGLDDEAALQAIFPQVQVACLIRWALLEGAALFACVILFLFHSSLTTQPMLSLCVALAIASSGLILLSAPQVMTLQELVREARRAAPARAR